jgi:hypothetical protein
MEPQKALNSQNTIGKENKADGTRLLDFIKHYSATIIKTAWFCHKSRHIDQWNRKESPEINAFANYQLIFDKNIH